MAECRQHGWTHSSPGASHFFTSDEKLWKLAAKANWWLKSSFISQLLTDINFEYQWALFFVSRGKLWLHVARWRILGQKPRLGKSDQIIVSVHPVLCWSDLPTMIATFRAGDRDVQGPGDVRCLPALQVGHDQVSKLFNKQISKLIFNKRNTLNETSCSQDQWSASFWSPFLLPQWTTEDLGKHCFFAEK